MHRDLNGAAVGSPTHWEAQLQTKTVPPRDDDTVVSNPIGFYVTNITWTEHGPRQMTIRQQLFSSSKSSGGFR